MGSVKGCLGGGSCAAGGRVRAAWGGSCAAWGEVRGCLRGKSELPGEERVMGYLGGECQELPGGSQGCLGPRFVSLYA